MVYTGKKVVTPRKNAYYVFYYNYEKPTCKKGSKMIRTLVSFRIGVVIQAYGNVTLYLLQSTLLSGLMNFCVNV